MCIRDSVCYDQAEKFESEPVYRKRQKMLEYVKKAPSLFEMCIRDSLGGDDADGRL